MLRKLDELGAELVRSKRHLVYRLPWGALFVCPKTPSDQRAQERALRDIRRLERQRDGTA